MKAYTDIEQSKKLAEVLPLESADMFWRNGASDKHFHFFTPFFCYGNDMDYDLDIPCWSLAALLEEIPERLFDSDGFSYDLEITEQQGLYYINYLNSEKQYYHVSVGCMNTLVDACVDMIIKLHE